MSNNNSRRSQRVPRYAEPNVATILPVYTNSEADYIKQSFSVGNYRSISSLPTELKTNNVNDARANHADNNITSKAASAHCKQVGKGALPNFSYFEYQPSGYGLADKLKSEELKSHREKRDEFCKKDWIYSSAHPRPALSEVQARFEHEKDYHDPYEDSNNESLSARWISEAKILHGPFVSSQKDNSLKVISHRGMIPDIMRSLAREIDADWEGAEFQIYRDEEDLIILEFHLNSIDNPGVHESKRTKDDKPSGLQAYMNILMNTNPVVSEHALSKIVELWDHRPGDGSVYYAFKGPWVARRADEVYYTLMPDRRNFKALQQHEAELAKQEQMEAQKGEK